MNYRATILLLAFMVSCSSRQRNNPGKDQDPEGQFKRENIGRYVQKYDSLKFYRDADWVTLKGKDELTGNYFQYPFTCWVFNGNKTETYFFFNPGRVIRWEFHKKDAINYTCLRHYDKEARDTIQNYFIYYPGGQLQLACFNPDLFSDKELSVRSVIKTISLDTSTIRQHLYQAAYGRRSVPLNDLLNFDSLRLSEKFEVYSETTLKLENNKLYQLSYYRREDGKTSIANQRIEKDPDFQYPSFLFFYADVFRTWDPS